MTARDNMERSRASGFVPRQRRRPALACEVCRRRKVKCDRKTPCGPCTLSRSATCVYSTEPTPVVRDRRSVATSAESGALPTPAQSKVLTPSDSTLSGSNVSPSVKTFPDISNLSSCISNHTSPPDTLNGKFYCFQEPQIEGGIEHGSVSKTRFFGQSHWMNNMLLPPFSKLKSFKYNLEIERLPEVAALVQSCKVIARTLKAGRPIHEPFPQQSRNLVPPKEVSDELLKCYFRTFESVYRVLHIPTFQEEYDRYWLDPSSACLPWVMKLLVVLAIGTCFYDDPELHKESTGWLSVVQSWLSSPMEKSRLNITGLQIHCLLLLAKQTNALAGDFIWMCAGLLLRTAMQMGLHREPTFFPKVSAFGGEIRRRLWATILEICLQSSLDAGMPPMISLQDFDCQPPSNYDDTDIDESLVRLPLAPQPEKLTQSTIQILLSESWPLRLQIAKNLNNLNSSPSYDETLKLDSGLTSLLRIHSNFLRSTRIASSISQPSEFQTKYFELLNRRFLLSLHRTFANESIRNPSYYYSRKVCQDVALAILASFQTARSSAVSTSLQDFGKLTISSGSLYRVIFVSCATAIAFELITQLQQDYTPGLPTPMDHNREELLLALRQTVEFSIQRVDAGETNIKGVLFMSCILAQAEALANGTNEDDALMEAATSSVQDCYMIMKRKLEASSQPQTSPQLDESFWQEDPNLVIEPDSFEFDVLLQQNLGFDFEFTNNWGIQGPNFSF